MDEKQNIRRFLKKSLSYLLVAVIASAGTWIAAEILPNSKLERLSAVIEHRFIGNSDQTKIQDAAAEAMIEALGDR